MTTLHFLITEYKHLSIKQLLQNKYIQSIALIGVCIFPWLLLTASHMSKLSSSWYFPVDFHLLSSVLGNMFIGYEGTPCISGEVQHLDPSALLALMALLLISKHQRKTNLFILLIITLPLAIVLGFSLIVKPMFVNRYLLPVTFGEIILIVSILELIKIKQFRFFALYFMLIFTVDKYLVSTPTRKTTHPRHDYADKFTEKTLRCRICYLSAHIF